MYRLNFYVPEENLEEVKESLFIAGAGRIGNYERCCWQVQGKGQFLPLAGSNPTIGKVGKIEDVKEYKVEMVCEDVYIKDVLNALLRSHPYEEPAYDIVKILDKNDF